MRYPNIQLLRVAAAVGVALFHLGHYARAVGGVDVPGLDNPWIAGLPVPLFFAVSGFVLAGAARHTTPGRFLLARSLRLYPGYWLAAGLMILACRLGAFNSDYDLFAQLVSWRTFALLPASPGRAVYLLGVEWSLVFEVMLSAAVGLFALAGRQRGVPVLAGVWLAVILGRIVFRPVDGLPPPLGSLATMLVSANGIPFLVGVLAYQVRDRGRRLWPVVLAAVGGLLAAGPGYAVRGEVQWVLWGTAAAGLVWLAVGPRQARPTHPLVRLGDCTYGLFLIHVPILLLVLYPAARAGWAGRPELAAAAGLAAVGGGLLYGRVEAEIHARLRPLPDRLHSAFLRPAARRVGWPLRPTPAAAPPRRAHP